MSGSCPVAWSGDDLGGRTFGFAVANPCLVTIRTHSRQRKRADLAEVQVGRCDTKTHIANLPREPLRSPVEPPGPASNPIPEAGGTGDAARSGARRIGAARGRIRTHDPRPVPTRGRTRRTRGDITRRARCVVSDTTTLAKGAHRPPWTPGKSGRSLLRFTA